MKETVLVVGDSLAGLTAALRLTQHGFAVTVIQSDAQIIDPSASEGFPFVYMGSDTVTHSLVQTLGATSDEAFSRLSLALLPPGRRLINLRRTWLPAPLHIVTSLAIFPGLLLRDRWRLLTWMERTWERNPGLPIDLDTHTAEAWLRGIGQSERARAQVWTPLARFLLGGDLKLLSAGSLLNELMRCFLSSHSASQAIIRQQSRAILLDDPLHIQLSGLGVAFQTVPIEHLTFDSSGVTGAYQRTGQYLVADRYILALPHHVVSSLLPERILTRFSYFQQLSELVDSPAVAVTLTGKDFSDASRLALIAGRTFHWMCVYPDTDHEGTRISFVSQGSSQTLEYSDERLLEEAITTFTEVFPYVRKADLSLQRITRTRRFRLLSTPGAAARRPLQQSPFKNLFLVGPWTDTGLSSSMESAIVSGERCAESIKRAEAT